MNNLTSKARHCLFIGASIALWSAQAVADALPAGGDGASLEDSVQAPASLVTSDTSTGSVDICPVAADVPAGFFPFGLESTLRVSVSPTPAQPLTQGQAETLRNLIASLRSKIEALPERDPENALDIKIQVLTAFRIGDPTWSREQWKDYSTKNQVYVWYTTGTLKFTCRSVAAINHFHVSLTPPGSSTIIPVDLSWGGGFDEDGFPAWQLIVSGFVSDRIFDPLSRLRLPFPPFKLPG